MLKPKTVINTDKNKKIWYILASIIFVVINFLCALIYSLWYAVLTAGNNYVASEIFIFSLQAVLAIIFTAIPVLIYRKTKDKKRFWVWFSISYFIFILLTLILLLPFGGI